MVRTVGIHIKVRDFQKSVVFYKALGFKPVFGYGPASEVREDYNGIVFEHGKTRLEIADGHRAVEASIFKAKVMSSKISLMIGVDRLSSVINACKKHAIKISVEPRHYYWGTLELVVKDPDGAVLVFVAEYDPVEAKKIKANESFSLKPISS